MRAPIPPPPLRPRFGTWIEWGKWAYVHDLVTLDEFVGYIERLLDEGRADDLWSPLPGGLNPLNAEGRLIVGSIDYTFEHEVELRAIRKGVHRRH